MSQFSDLNANQAAPRTEPPRWQFSISDLLTLTTSMSLYVAAIMVVIRKLGASPAHGLQLVFVHGLAAALLLIMFRTQIKQSAGRTLAHLRRRLRPMWWFLTYGWFPLLSVLLIPPAPTGDFEHALYLVLLFGLVYSAAFGASSALSCSVVLGENGVIYDGQWFVPWRRSCFGRPHSHAVHYIDDHLALTLGRGWFRTEAIVPPEQREAVEALLKVKLGDRGEAS